MNGTETRQGTSFVGARAQCRSVLFGTVSTIAVAFAIATPANSTSGNNCTLPGNPSGVTCTMSGRLDIYSGQSFTNSGTANNPSFEIYVSSGTFINEGTVNNSYYFTFMGGTFINTGTFNHLAGPFFLLPGNVSNAGTFNNASTILFSNSTFENAGTFNNSGSLVTGSSMAGPMSGTFLNSGIFNNTGAIGIPGGFFSFENQAGGTFNAGGTIIVNGFANAGTFVVAGSGGAIATQALTGNYVQTSTGKLDVRADWTGNSGAGAADLLAISGTAALAGTVVVNPINFPTTGGLTKQFTVLTADQGITNNGISIANTAAVNYALLFPNTNTMDVQATINFQGVGLGNLNTNQKNVGGNLNTVLGGGTTLPFMPALMQLPSGGALGGALHQLAPIGDGSSFSTAMTTGAQFGQHLLSCRMVGEEGDANRFIKEGQCVWARVNARRLDNDGRTDGVGYRETATFFSAGAQIAVAQDWRIGAGLGYETMNLSTASNASSEGERLHLGGVVKYTPGPLLLAASVTGGLGWHDNRRHVSFGGFGATATSSNDSSFVASRLTAAYLISRGMLYAKPQVELAATRLMRDAYTEHGTGGIALAVAKASDTVLSASPSLELGVEQRSADGFVTRAFVKGGATIRDTDTFVTTATFADAPGAPAFAISSKVDRTVADIGAGLDLISAGGSALRLQYDGQFGDRTTQHSGGAKLSVKF